MPNLPTHMPIFSTFRCRLDQASSAPPALKLIVAAVAEVREVLTGLANSSTVVQDTTNTAGNHGYSTQANSGEEGDHGPDLIKDQSATAKTLSAIVRNCGFLLKCPRLPVVSLSRLVCLTYRHRELSMERYPSLNG